MSIDRIIHLRSLSGLSSRCIMRQLICKPKTLGKWSKILFPSSWTHLMGFVVSFLVLLAFVGFPSLFNADNTAEHARAAMQIFLCKWCSNDGLSVGRCESTESCHVTDIPLGGTSILYFCSSLAHTLSCNWKYRHSIWMVRKGNLFIWIFYWFTHSSLRRLSLFFLFLCTFHF